MDQMIIHFSTSPLMEQVLRTKENCLVDDFLGSSFCKGERREKYADNFALCIPLILGGEPIGALNFNGNSKGYFDKRDFGFAELTAEMIARSLRNARLMSEQKKLATQDGLTKLLNHRNFYEQLDIEFSRAKRFAHPLSVVMLDIDYFKKINDTYGHPAGDAILKEMAKRIKSELRSVDIVARYGGEEFGLVLPESDSKASMLVAERIRQKVCTAPFGTDKGEINVTVSIGVCDSSSQAITDGTDMVKKADKALYKSKHSGRNKITLYEPGAE
jgi:diguanylate cyclase (GGDEF)-like protein